MAGPIFIDRVKETTTTTGTGAYTLAGAVGGFQAFSAWGNGNTGYYAVSDGAADWEVGLGTYTASGTTLARTAVLASSNGGAAVNWSAGSKTIWGDAPALFFAGLVTSAGAFSPSANDGKALGTATLAWADLFGASGFVFNLANGDWIATHTTGILTVGTGDLRVSNAGTNSASVVTVGGSQSLTNKTLNGLTVTTTTGTLTVTGAAVLTVTDTTTVSANQRISTITIIIDGGGAAITTGVKADLEIPFAATITQWTLLADQSGSIVVDVWKDTYANYPPTNADSITASAKPTISAATKGQSSTLTGWTTSIAAGDTLRFNVDSASTITRATLSLRVTRT